MLVLRQIHNIATGKVTEEWVEDPTVVTPEAQAQADQQAAATAQAAASNETTIGQQAVAAMDSLRAVRDGGALSAAQQTAFNKLVAKVLILLIRAALKRFDAAA